MRDISGEHLFPHLSASCALFQGVNELAEGFVAPRVGCQKTDLQDCGRRPLVAAETAAQQLA